MRQFVHTQYVGHELCMYKHSNGCKYHSILAVTYSVDVLCQYRDAHEMYLADKCYNIELLKEYINSYGMDYLGATTGQFK